MFYRSQASRWGRDHTSATITIRDGVLTYQSSYRSALVDELKRRIPAPARRWSPEKRVWLTEPQYADVLQDITRKHLHVEASIHSYATGPTVPPAIETRNLAIHYLAAAKQWEGDSAAFAWCDDNWNVIFPEVVLRQWFGGRPERPPPWAPTTLYEVLGVKDDANSTEIRSAHRRMVRMWHPDVCKEPTAHSRFIQIQGAYDILTNSKFRARYDAGLQMAQVAAITGKAKKPAWIKVSYRAPLLCGLVRAEGREKLGRFVVEKILSWGDIYNSEGQVLVSSWPEDAKMFIRIWV